MVSGTQATATEVEPQETGLQDSANERASSGNNSGRGFYSRPALAAWEAMFRATTTLSRSFEESDAWGDLSQPEYAMLYALSKRPEGVRICELGQDVLLTQTGLSRLAARLVERGLVERLPDQDDGRATLLILTAQGIEAQKRVGRKHAREITAAMTRALDDSELQQLYSICRALMEVIK